MWLIEARRELWTLHIKELHKLAQLYWGCVPELMTKRDLVYELAYDHAETLKLQREHGL